MARVNNKTSYAISVLPSAKGIGDVLGRMTLGQLVEQAERDAREAAAEARWRGLDTAAKNAAYSTTEREREECARLGRPEYRLLHLATIKERKYRRWLAWKQGDNERLERAKQEWLAGEIVKAWQVEKAQEDLPGLVLREKFERTLKGICDDEEYSF